MSLRKPVYAGQFYPADQTQLRMAISKAFKDAAQITFSPEGQPGGKPVPLKRNRDYDVDSAPVAPWTVTSPLLTLVPHAGYAYSGPVLGAALKGINLPKRLIILAPNHTGMGHPMAYWPEGSWQTPLGMVRIDEELGEELHAAGEGFLADTKAHLKEHSIEIILPFLQTMRPDLTIMPIVMSRNYNLDRVAHALAAVIKDHLSEGLDNGVGIIISSDMNHYGSETHNRHVDFMAIDAILRVNPEALAYAVKEHRISMCGFFAAYTGLLVCDELGAVHTRLMGYGTSGATSGDLSSVVGYAGIRIW